MDSTVRIFFNPESSKLREAAAEAKQYFGMLGTEAERAHKRGADAARNAAKITKDQQDKAMLNIATYEAQTKALREKYSKETTASLIADLTALQAKKVAIEKASLVETQTNVLKQQRIERDNIAIQIKDLQLLARERKDVQEHGAGIAAGIMGIGRHIVPMGGGVIGGIAQELQMLGPAGMAAGIGIGAVGVALTHAMKTTIEMEDALADLRTSFGGTDQQMEVVRNQALHLAQSLGVNAVDGVKAARAALT